MGFLDAIKANALCFGDVESADFQSCKLTTKEDHFIITRVGGDGYEFRIEDVTEFRVVANGETWIKYKMSFKDGKIAIVHATVQDPKQKGTVSTAPLERFFAHLL